MKHDGRVVVTDLDGCLLDATSYRWEPAGPALTVLKRRGISALVPTDASSTAKGP